VCLKESKSLHFEEDSREFYVPKTYVLMLHAQICPRVFARAHTHTLINVYEDRLFIYKVTYRLFYSVFGFQFQSTFEPIQSLRVGT
jgi:hypothetical protein